MATKISLWDIGIIKSAIRQSIFKFSPRHQFGNPVMFTVYIGALLTTGLYIQSLVGLGDAAPRFILEITIWLWFTLFFANFAEAMAEGRGKAQAQALRKARREIQAKKLSKADRQAKQIIVQSADLRAGDIVLIEAGDFVPSDGEVLEGIASVNESAITGESAPVIREVGSALTGGTQVISDWLIMKIMANPGETF